MAPASPGQAFAEAPVGPPPTSGARLAAGPQPIARPAPPAGPSVVRTDAGAKDGLEKCARCGATDISLNIATGNLRCNFCRFEQVAAKALEVYHLDGDIDRVIGTVVGSGSEDIVPSTDEVLTFKCGACGAEVVIDTRSSTQARCHWCRNMLSMNQQVPNGAVPDMILPFALAKDSAVAKIAEFVRRRTFFAHPAFKREFNPDNVMGVYLPYMVADLNTRASLSGQGEHQTRTYTVKNNDKNETRYDADLYDVAREFGLYISDLTVESSSQRRDQSTSQNSNNIINSIMPFDVENSVCYRSNYLSGFTSERRDSNLADLTPIAFTQAQDIARHQANRTLAFYDRGVRWDDEQLELRGQRWVSAYLPVWLYSYHQRKSGGRSFCHYVAVNARTGETMGSVPVNHRRLLLMAAVVQVLGIVLFVVFGLVL